MMRLVGLDLIGAQTIPTVGATYTDAKTVLAVQSALVKRGYNLGDSGPNKDGVDGVFGSKTKAAIKKLQGFAGLDQTGKIDTQVLQALGNITPGVLPPGVTLAGHAAVQAEVALEAATYAEHQAGLSNPDPADVQTAAQQAVDAAPAEPPELKQAAQKALSKAKSASTPADVKAAAKAVQQAATDVHQAVKPSWFSMPAWEGGPPRWHVAALGGSILVVSGVFLYGMYGGDQAPTSDRIHRKLVRGKISSAEYDKRYREYQAKYDAWRKRQDAKTDALLKGSK